jgi:hypothetical protein
VAERLRHFLAGAGAEDLARVKSRLALDDSARVPPLDAMIRSLDALYERFGIDPAAPLDAGAAPVRELLAKNLDGSLFRQELVRLADEMAQMRSALEATLEFERAQARDFKTEAQQWIAKLEADVKGIQAELARDFEARLGLTQEIAQLSIHRDALLLLPAPVRRYLLKKIVNARS